MGTWFTEIYDLALILIEDNKLIKLYKTDTEAFLVKMQSLLMRAIPKFDCALESLSFSIDMGAFDNVLSPKAIDILADLIAIMWLESETNVSVYINGALGNREFKRHSESPNLDSKRKRLAQMRERVEQDQTNYQNRNLDKISWFN